MKAKFKYKRVKIIWWDICSSDEAWILEDDILNHDIATCSDVGYIYKKTKVTKIDKLKTKVKIHTKNSGKSQIIDADIVLNAMGITGNIENIGLEQIKMATDQGAIKINEFNQTSIPTIYAIGDVSGPPWLAHVASAQGHVAAEHASGYPSDSLDYNNIPSCIYSINDIH